MDAPNDNQPNLALHLSEEGAPWSTTNGPREEDAPLVFMYAHFNRFFF